MLAGVTVNVPPGTNNFGIWISNGASAVMRDVNVTVGASPNHSYGVILTQAGPVAMTGMNVVADAFGIVVQPGFGLSAATLDRSTIKGNFGAVTVNILGPPSGGPVFQVGGSQLIGGVSAFSGVVCVGSYNGAYAALSATCQ